MCSWCEASARAPKGETCADQMTDSFQAHKDVMQFLSQARAMRSALVKRLYCAVCAVFMGVLSTQRERCVCVFVQRERGVCCKERSVCVCKERGVCLC